MAKEKQREAPKAELAKLLTSVKALDDCVVLLKKHEASLKRAASDAKKYKDLAKFKPK